MGKPVHYTARSMEQTPRHRPNHRPDEESEPAKFHQAIVSTTQRRGRCSLLALLKKKAPSTPEHTLLPPPLATQDLPYKIAHMVLATQTPHDVHKARPSAHPPRKKGTAAAPLFIKSATNAHVPFIRARGRKPRPKTQFRRVTPPVRPFQVAAVAGVADRG